MSTLEKFASFIGFIGFAMLVPGIMYVLGNAAAVEFLSANLGMIGDPSVMTSLAFVLITLAIFFGGGDNVSATLLGMLTGFFFISTAIDIGFMEWFRSFITDVSFMGNVQLNYLVGIGVVVLGLLFSFAKKVKFLPQVMLLVAFPIGFVATTNHYGWMKYESEFSISMDKGFGELAQAIDEKYRSMPAVVQFMEDIKNDAGLSEEQKEAKMQELQQKIGKMEDDTQTLAALRKENEQYKKLLEDQQKALENIGWCSSSKDSSNQVKDFTDAVLPNQPCVRDFAVSLVKNEQGAFYDRALALPGASGIRQIGALHVHLSSNWKYVSDPTLVLNDFYSPADRSIALGLAGDCDDYAIVMASSVEAIGGASRIMGGFCAGGGHAWAEVLIGKESHWNTAVNRLQEFYNDPNKQFTPNIDEEGLYWLPLDWRIGEYTCNNYPDKLVVLYTPKERLERAVAAMEEEQSATVAP
ncbi:MAG: transglutaminase domain-containing protein [Flammeovirgaceae bacterium]